MLLCFLVLALSPAAILADYGYINKSGTLVIPARFGRAYDFDQGLARVRNASRIYGFIDKSGNTAIPFQYSEARDFTDSGVASVQPTGASLYQIINRQGQAQCEPRFERPLFFFGGMAKIRVGNLYGFIDASCETVIQPRFFEAGPFYNGELAFVGFQDSYGFINRQGEFAFPQRFQQASSFGHEGFENFARVKIGGRTGVINTTGEIVMQPRYGTVADFGDGLFPAILQAGKWGYINMQNEVVIQPQFEWASRCYDNRCKVQLNGKWGFVDTSGNMVIPAHFDDVGNLDGPYARATLNGEDIFINRSGENFAQVPADWLGQPGEGLVPFRDPSTRKFGYLDEDGNVAIPASYCMAGGFSEGLAKVKPCD